MGVMVCGINGKLGSCLCRLKDISLACLLLDQLKLLRTGLELAIFAS